MNALSMIKREPFYEILQDTTNEYARVVYGEEIDFSEEKSKEKDKMHFFLVSSFLSAVPVSKGVKKSLYSEYNVRGSIIKYIVGKLGVFVITHSGKFFAKKTFYFSKNAESLKNVMISPCNRSIRYFNFDNEYVDCYVKHSYSNAYMQNQLRFRLQEKYDFVPRVVAYGDRWYREKIMHGNALARVTDDEVYLLAQNEALSFMKQIACDTLKNVSAKDYLDELKNEYFKLIEHFSNENRNELGNLGESVFSNAFDAVRKSDLQVPLALSHGDFQAGNIWVDEEKRVTIYDWETVKWRSVWFDPATLYLRLHSCYFIEDLEDRVRDESGVFVNDEKKDYSTDEKAVVSLLIYIENILFFLDDMAQLPIKYSNSTCKNYIDAMKRDMEKKGI